MAVVCQNRIPMGWNSSAAERHHEKPVVRLNWSVTRTLQPLAAAVAKVRRQHREKAMMTYVISEGRLLGLTPSEWSMMLGGVALCGFITLLF